MNESLLLLLRFATVGFLRQIGIARSTRADAEYISSGYVLFVCSSKFSSIIFSCKNVRTIRQTFKADFFKVGYVKREFSNVRSINNCGNNPSCKNNDGIAVLIFQILLIYAYCYFLFR